MNHFSVCSFFVHSIDRDASGLDYLPWLDRYTCDDPLVSGGYTYHYDIATGTWGLWPCIENPDNVPPRQPGPVIPLNPPTPSVPPLLQPPPPSPGPICDSEKPCRVVLGANRVNTFGELVEQIPYRYRTYSTKLVVYNWMEEIVPYHHYVLVEDPNNIQRAGFSAPEPVNNVTTYHFGAFSEKVLIREGILPGPDYAGPYFWGFLIPMSGIYQNSLDAISPQNSGTLNPQRQVLDDNANCNDVLKCFLNVSTIIHGLKLDYNAVGLNSNTFSRVLLQQCGLNSGSTANNVLAPGWSTEISLE